MTRLVLCSPITFCDVTDPSSGPNGTYTLTGYDVTASGQWFFTLPAKEKNPRGRTLEQIIKGTVYDRCRRRKPRHKRAFA